MLSRDLPHNGKSRHPISGACFCVEYLILLALIGSVEERHDLCTGAVRIRAERRGRSTVRHVVRYRPVDGVSVERVRGNIREARAALDLLAEGAVQEKEKRKKGGEFGKLSEALFHTITRMRSLIMTVAEMKMKSCSPGNVSWRQAAKSMKW